jgi:hypothetical protein
MNIKELKELTAAEELRILVSNLNVNSETFNDKYSIEELIQINRMLMLADWEIYPDQWSQKQIKEALQGIPPSWKKDGKPEYYDFQFLLNYFCSLLGTCKYVLAEEFEVHPSVVEKWLQGTSKPHNKLQKLICISIKKQLIKGHKLRGGKLK